MNRMVMKYHSAESPFDYVFILHLKARDHTSINHISPWYSLWMSFKVPHSFTVMAIGQSVKWP